MPRRIVVLGLLAVLSQLGSGCCCLRDRIAYRWHYFHPNHGCRGCSPTFKVPAPLATGPAVGPVYTGAAYAPGTPGCASCGAPEVGPVAVAGPVSYPVGAFPAGQPTFTNPSPLLNPSVEPLHTPSLVPSGTTPPAGGGTIPPAGGTTPPNVMPPTKGTLN